MRRIPFLHLWLCALLSLQQPSVLVQAGFWHACPQGMAVEDPPRAGVLEEAELPGLRSGSQARWAASAKRRWRAEPRRVPRLSGQVALAPPSRAPHPAVARWREALMPPRVPPDDEQRLRG